MGSFLTSIGIANRSCSFTSIWVIHSVIINELFIRSAFTLLLIATERKYIRRNRLLDHFLLEYTQAMRVHETSLINKAFLLS